MSKRKEKTVILSEGEFEDLLYFSSYRASRRSNDELFKGLMPIVNRLLDRIDGIEEQLEYIKRSMKLEEPVESKEKELPITEKRSWQSLSDKVFGNITEEQKANISKALKEQISTNNLIHNQIPLPKLPDLRKE
jgi:hypothetical protein